MLSFSKKKNPLSHYFSIFLGILMFLTSFSVFRPVNVKAVTPANGQLKIVGSQLCNQSGTPVQLKGMSSHGLQWYGQFMNYDSIKTLRDSWGANVVRAAMYTAEGGYISNPTTQMAKVKEIIQAAIDLGIYVIVDWHILSDNNPNTYREQAKSFFQQIATAYGSYPNVIYEICNEPNGSVTWANDIKPYAQYIIPAIRAIDPDNIVIVGTSTWSQDVNIAADSPLAYSNVMYTCHFYAGTHTQWLRDRIDYAMNKGIAVFVTEWGSSDASGNGGPYLDEAQRWVDYMAAKKISWANWSLCDKAETSAALKPGSSPTGGWTDANLTTSGAFVKKNMGGIIPIQKVAAPTFNIPAGTYTSAQSVALSCATTGATIRYTTNGTTPTASSPVYTGPITVASTTTIKAYASLSGMTDSDVSTAVYTIGTSVQKVANPTFSIPAGTYSSAQNVTLTCATSGATIRYTTDGTTPTASSPIYSAPITISKTTTIKAFAAKSGMTNSDVVSSTYTIGTQPQSSVVVTYAVTNDWGNGATINITIKNNGTTPINGWTLVWTFPGNQVMRDIWSATYTTSGATVTARNVSYNASIPANGGTQSFGFNISYSGSNPKPTSFTLNGIPCQVQ